MPRHRFDNLDPNKKAKLLDAAMKEFAARGYGEASINRILEVAGLSKGSFYYYFDDKADFAATVFFAATQPDFVIGTLQTPSSAAGFWDELRRMSFEQTKLMHAKRTEYECAIRLSNALKDDPALAARILPRFDPGREKLGVFLAKGVELGALRRDLPLGTLMSIIEAMKAAAYQAIFPGDQIPTEAELRAFTDVVIDLAERISAPKKG